MTNLTSPTARATLSVKARSPGTCILLGLVTGGLYCLYWFFVTAREMNEQGARVPSGWLMFVPGVNLWWFWRWCVGAQTYTRGYLGAGTALIFLLVVPAIEAVGVLGADIPRSALLPIALGLAVVSLSCISVPILQSTLNRFRTTHLAEAFD